MQFLQELDFDPQEENILGIDETGVGDYFTPIISRCAFSLKEMINWTYEIGVRDSKLLNDDKIDKIASILIKKIPFAVYVLTQSGYNKMINKGFNANVIKFFIHTQSILNFQKRYEFDKKIIIDKYSTLNAINNYQRKMSFIRDFSEFYKKNELMYFLEHGEQKIQAIACASIIARHYLNNYMKNQNDKWGFNFLLGANQKVKSQINEFTKKFGKQNLEKVIKTNFKI